MRSPLRRLNPLPAIGLLALALTACGGTEPATGVTGAPRPDDGRKLVGGEDCRVRPLTLRFAGRPLTAAEKAAGLPLPYQSTLHHPVAANRHEVRTLDLGQATGYAQGTPYVVNSQVVGAIDVTRLPPRRALTQVDLLALRMKVVKVSHDRHLGSELLCFLDQRICSGELFTARTWQSNVNPKFFGEDRPVNDVFARSFLDREVGRLGTGRLYAAELTLPLGDLLRGSEFEDPLDLLYGPEGDLDPAQPLARRTLKLAVADDTYVSDLELLLDAGEDECESARLAAGR